MSGSFHTKAKETLLAAQKRLADAQAEQKLADRIEYSKGLKKGVITRCAQGTGSLIILWRHKDLFATQDELFDFLMRAQWTRDFTIEKIGHESVKISV